LGKFDLVSCLRLFVTDTLKGYMLMALFGIPIFILLMGLISWGGEYFYLYMMGATLALMLIFMQIIPTFIMPLFNKVSIAIDSQR
jgi:STE24 endopeptidase